MRIIVRDQVHQVNAGLDLRSALKKLGIPSESVLAIRNGEMITEDTILNAGEEIKLIHVISGG